MSNESRLMIELEKKFGKAKISGNGWIRIPCPTCSVHNRNKMKRYLNASCNTSKCFICGVDMDVQDLVGGNYMPSYDPNEIRKPIEKKIDPRSLELPCYDYIPINELPFDHPAIKFLHKDFLYDLDSYWENYRMMWIPTESGKVFRSIAPYTTSSERIVFPVFFQGKMIGWQMRSIPGTFYGDRKDVIRYYHLFDKGSHLYNYDRAKQYDEVVVVEGVKKALKFPNGVATWGAGISPQQLKLIQEWPKIVMMLDGEDHNNTQARAKGFVENFKFAGKTAINIDLRKYGGPTITSPDEVDSATLKDIVKEEWHVQYGI